MRQNLYCFSEIPFADGHWRSTLVCFRPIFSTDDINMDKHKMERFLHPGRFSVASVFAPICFSPLPLVVFKEAENGDLTLAASGSLKCVDPDRIILKKIILSGYVFGYVLTS